MRAPGRRYRYVGPEEVRRAVAPGAGGRVVRGAADLDAWAAEQGTEGRAPGAQRPEETFTFVVGPDGLLRLAHRRSEHVACAGGGDVPGPV
ncbi:hypothetical protein ACIHAR_26075 [Streptomyces sp. NPDC052016]|uniref:hypothetical protein n=1 Tax=unclassified Streptomyces TaxID=2593676 RepID=UPI003424CF77